jgi:predicted dinucleotide-binding enzyme
VVKAFNTTGSGNMADPRYGAGAPVMFVAGDDDDAKQTAMDLASGIGFDATDAGPLAAARDLEHLAALWIRLAYPLGHGPEIAFVLARR